jgi:hypothetical protein
MKVAMKNAMQPLKPSTLQSVKRPVIERIPSPVKEPGPDDTDVTPRRPAIQEKTKVTTVPDESADIPPFCQNCGKKIPPAANFCPGCGTKLGAYKVSAPAGMPESPPEKKTTHHEAPAREKKGAVREDMDEDEKEDELPVPTKPPAKKAPKGGEMTILHKFLRR